ncbi:coiled-coil domain-containing protein 93 [Tribolium madens]|uniref:coiled-coil domain-containing protein 93 n=1 Tax=Tribolium madens TaxID=41895 RepID=UPI001CF75DAD|nr:coiled-coil domain-containing protein 93 [Tribolium madens]
MFQKFKSTDLPKQDLNDHKFDVREDEEQSVKLQEIIDLLVAAGYFRARIKGLSPFDKVVGGMTWCIESCNVDVDVDLLFQENSTIGQKIALTEKIVIVLPKLKCPHSIEPHQIQGLDFIHIFPVIQWLVKRSLEFRQEMSEFVRKYAVNQYHKAFGRNTKKETNILKNINLVNEIYAPKRYYKRKNAPPPEIQAQVQITLLEYGNATKHNIETLTNESVEHEDLNTEDLKNLAEHYTSLQLEFKTGGLKHLQEKQKATLEEQLRIITEKCDKLATKKSTLHEKLTNIEAQDQEIKTKIQDLSAKIKELKQNENDKTRIEEVEELVMLNENLKMQESQFREYCKREMAQLQKKIEEIKNGETVVENDTDKIPEELIENVRVIRLHLAKRNRTVAALRRQIDDVPNRPELAQYQRRFLELYNQVSAKHKETKQYFTLYNTLEDTKFYMKKELSLLNSVSDSYPEAMLSASGKEEFLKQFQNIVEGVKHSKEKVERKLVDEKRKRDQLSAALQVLIEQQRKYVAAIRQLSIECKKHEALVAEYKC